MSDAVKEKDIAKDRPAPAPEQKGGTNWNPYLIGGLILAAAALAAYQFFGCDGCYAPI